MARDRSQQSRSVHADEIISTKGLKDRLDALEQKVAAGDTTEILTGVPQAATPYLIAERVGENGLIYPTVRFTSLASNLRRFWIHHRKVKPNGDYGRDLEQKVTPTEFDIAANSKEVEIDKGLKPNTTYHLVWVEAKLTGSNTNDGGSRDQDPPDYEEVDAPDGTQLATFTTGSGQVGPEAENEGLNTKLRYSIAAWGNDDEETAANDPDNSRLAKWRHGNATGTGGASGSYVRADTPANLNYWSKAGSSSVPRACLFMASSTVTLDLCNRLDKNPFDPGESVFVTVIAKTVGVLNALDNANINLVVTIEDSVAGVVATTTCGSIGGRLSNTQWREILFPETAISAYTPSSTSKQWARLHLSASVTSGGGRGIVLDKIRFGHVQGAYKPNPRDRQRNSDPDAIRTADSNRATLGYGRTGNEASTGTGAITIRAVTD